MGKKDENSLCKKSDNPNSSFHKRWEGTMTSEIIIMNKEALFRPRAEPSVFRKIKRCKNEQEE